MQTPAQFVLLTLSLSVAALAQDQPQMSRLYRTEVPLDSTAEFFAVQRDTAEIYKANKASFARHCWTSLAGVQMFYMRVPLSGLDQLTGDTWLQKQGTEMQRAGRMSRLRNSSGRNEVLIITSQPEESWDDTPNDAPDPFATVTIDRVKPGKTREYRALTKEAGAAFKRMGKAKAFRVSRVTYGGNTYEFIVYIGYSSLAEITFVEDFRKAMGAKYDEFTRKMGEVLDSRERTIVRYRPEFSYMPAN